MRTKCFVLSASESRFCKMYAFKTVYFVAVLIEKTNQFFRYAYFIVAACIAYRKSGEAEMYLFNPFFFENIHGMDHDRVKDSLPE